MTSPSQRLQELREDMKALLFMYEESVAHSEIDALNVIISRAVEITTEACVEAVKWPVVRDKMHEACKNYCGEDTCCFAKQSRIVELTCDAVLRAKEELTGK